ncbi:MAG: helix-turn-helix domain-containing protein [Nitrospirae bacterium]|nr:helix-turn-helix domain-containing protein [Nitrospirota bacterium]
MEGQRLVGPKEAAEYLTVSERTLASWRNYRRGPTFRKLGKATRYAIEDLDSFLSQAVVATKPTRAV